MNLNRQFQPASQQMGLTKTSGQLAPCRVAGLRSVVVRGPFPSRSRSRIARPPARRPHRAIRRLCVEVSKCLGEERVKRERDQRSLLIDYLPTGSRAAGGKRASGKFPQNRQTREAAGARARAQDVRKKEKRERRRTHQSKRQAPTSVLQGLSLIRERVQIRDSSSSEDSTERELFVWVLYTRALDRPTDSWRICGIDSTSNNSNKRAGDDTRMARTASGKALMKTRTGEDCEAQLMRACDFDTLQMEQAEFLMTTIMDARAEQDAFEDLDERGMQRPSAEGDDEDGVCSPVSESVEEVAALSPEEDSTATPVSSPAAPVASTPSPSTVLSVPQLTLSLLESDEDQPVQWNPLISPLREEDEVVEEAELSSPEPLTSRVVFNQDGDDDREDREEGDMFSIAEPDSELGMEERLRELVESANAKALEAKLSRGTLGEYGADEDFTVDSSMDEDDEEFEVYNTYNVVKERTRCSEELFEEKLDSIGTEEDDNEDCTDGTRTSVATTLDDSCEESPRTSSSAAASRLGRRFRANTYTGAASTYVRNSCAMIRSRTLSSTSSFRNSSQSSTSEMDADVDFSSDDEGYSRDHVFGTSGGGGRYSLRSRLSSVGGSFRVPANLKLLRFRTSSATTTTSEDSFCNDNSYANSPRSTGEVHSAPPSFSSAGTSQQEHQNNHHQMQALKLKASACASKAAGYLNAASAEAARKLKSKTFRSAKPVASETDVDADPLPSPPSCLVHDGA